MASFVPVLRHVCDLSRGFARISEGGGRSGCSFCIVEATRHRQRPPPSQQLGASSESVDSLISEGFAQSTDRHFAEYLYRARGSSKELRNQMRVVRGRGHITEEERAGFADRYVEIEKMLTGLIRHLRTEDRQDRP
jgi:four helix bundle protein